MVYAVSSVAPVSAVRVLRVGAALVACSEAAVTEASANRNCSTPARVSVPSALETTVKRLAAAFQLTL